MQNKPVDFVLFLMEKGLNTEDGLEIIDALKILNKNNYSSYLEFTLAAKENYYARLVKIADIIHNLSDLTKGSMKEKYELALYILNN